jgi:hypothetical protein
MANDKIYDRHVNFWINRKEVTNDIKSIDNLNICITII